MKIPFLGLEVRKLKDERGKGMMYDAIGAKMFQSEVNVNKTTLYQIYKNNCDIKSCVRKIANYVGKEGFYLKNIKDEKVEYQEAKDDYEIIYTILANPTFTQSKIEMFKHLTTCGELFILPTTDPSGKTINGFQIIHPKTITKLIFDGKITGFMQSNGIGKATFFANETKEKTKRLSYYRLEKHTDNELNGMGIVEGLLYDALSDFSGAKRNYYFFENDATPPSILVVKENLSEANIKLLAQEIREKHSGPENAHRMMLGIGVEDVKSTSMTPKDMEHVQQRKLTIDKVSSAYGVPKAILGYTDNVNYNNAQQMYKEFIEGTINPLQDFFEFILNDFLTKYRPDFAKKYYVEFNAINVYDKFEIDKLRIEKVQSGILTVNEARTLDGREPYDIEEADKPLMSKGVSLLEDITLDPIIDTTDS